MSTIKVNNIVPPNVGEVVSIDGLQSTSLNGGQLAGFRNQIINGNMDIGQRAVSDVPDFTADRWRGQGVNVRYYVDSQGQFYRSIGPLEPSKNIVQGIELNYTGQRGQFEVGTTWTFSMYTDSVAPGASVSFRSSTDISATPLLEQGFTLTQTGETEGSLNRWSGTVTLSSGSIASSTCLILSVAVTTNEKFTGCQLEPGPVATPFEQRPMGTELALCQRYYEVISCMHRTVVWPAVANLVYWKVTKRVPPSLQSWVTAAGSASAGWRPDMNGTEAISAAYQYIVNNANQGGFLTADAEL